jgi:hypothetical protein
MMQLGSRGARFLLGVTPALVALGQLAAPAAATVTIGQVGDAIGSDCDEALAARAAP